MRGRAFHLLGQVEVLAELLERAVLGNRHRLLLPRSSVRTGRASEASLFRVQQEEGREPPPIGRLSRGKAAVQPPKSSGIRAHRGCGAEDEAMQRGDLADNMMMIYSLLNGLIKKPSRPALVVRN